MRYDRNGLRHCFGDCPHHLALHCPHGIAFPGRCRLGALAAVDHCRSRIFGNMHRATADDRPAASAGAQFSQSHPYRHRVHSSSCCPATRHWRYPMKGCSELPMRKNAKESVNCNGVNPEYDGQVEGNPAFFPREMVNVPLWNDWHVPGKNRLACFAPLPRWPDSTGQASDLPRNRTE